MAINSLDHGMRSPPLDRRGCAPNKTRLITPITRNCSCRFRRQVLMATTVFDVRYRGVSRLVGLLCPPTYNGATFFKSGACRGCKRCTEVLNRVVGFWPHKSAMSIMRYRIRFANIRALGCRPVKAAPTFLTFLDLSIMQAKSPLTVYVTMN